MRGSSLRFTKCGFCVEKHQCIANNFANAKFCWIYSHVGPKSHHLVKFGPLSNISSYKEMVLAKFCIAKWCIMAVMNQPQELTLSTFPFYHVTPSPPTPHPLLSTHPLLPHPPSPPTPHPLLPHPLSPPTPIIKTLWIVI